MPLWLHNGAAFGVEDPELWLDGCFIRIAQLRHNFKYWKSLSPITESEISRTIARSILDEAQGIDHDLAEWTAGLPSTWAFDTYLDPSWPHPDTSHAYDGASYDGTMHVYSSLQHAVTWNRYRGARLISSAIIAILLSACDLATASFPYIDSGAANMSAQSNLQVLVDEICASVAYSLGQTGNEFEFQPEQKLMTQKFSVQAGFTLFWPLIIAVGISAIPEHQRGWLRRKLLLISQMADSGIVESVARGN